MATTVKSITNPIINKRLFKKEVAYHLFGYSENSVEHWVKTYRIRELFSEYSEEAWQKKHKFSPDELRRIKENRDEEIPWTTIFPDADAKTDGQKKPPEMELSEG